MANKYSQKTKQLNEQINNKNFKFFNNKVINIKFKC